MVLYTDAAVPLPYRLRKPRFGMRLCSGVCPPSKPMGTWLPDLLFCPLCPLPAVFPRPDPGPRAFRRFALRAPGLSRMVFSASRRGGSGRSLDPGDTESATSVDNERASLPSVTPAANTLACAGRAPSQSSGAAQGAAARASAAAKAGAPVATPHENDARVDPPTVVSWGDDPRQCDESAEDGLARATAADAHCGAREARAKVTACAHMTSRSQLVVTPLIYLQCYLQMSRVPAARVL